VKVAHIEAGLRTQNIYSPWPEEGHRKLVAAIAELHFAPTELSRQNLLKENIADEKIVVTGNTVIDALLEVVEKLKCDQQLTIELDTQFQFLNKDKPLVLITGHRRENFGKGFERICEAIVKLAQMHPEVEFVYPLHLNPKVREPVNRWLMGQSNIFIIEPLNYLQFVYLMNRSYLLLTDSGGIQEEAPSLGKPVLVMRDITERPEAIAAGTVKLVGTDVNVIVTELSNLITDKTSYESMSFSHNPYGDGMAVKRILNSLYECSSEK
jgi:UDP-N-acetylglucosamine 2-epimerase (non-hydrolysing)